MSSVQKASLLLLLPAIAAFHAAILHALLALKTPWSLDVAESLSFANPDVLAAQAQRYREAEPQLALDYWLRAAELRPLWPYYQLGALDAEVRLQLADEKIQQRLNKVLAMAPNERGLDKGLLELAILRWHSLTDDQQRQVQQRFLSASFSSRQFALEVARRVKKKYIICAELPWQQVKQLCR